MSRKTKAWVFGTVFVALLLSSPVFCLLLLRLGAFKIAALGCSLWLLGAVLFGVWLQKRWGLEDYLEDYH